MKTKYFVANVVINVIIVSVLSVVGFLSFGVFSTKEVAGRTAIYRGNGEKPYVSLMFNVYWGTEYISQILNVLSENNATTTFFVGGIWASKNPETLRLIYESGHEIGNHGYLHKEANKLTLQENYDEINMTNKLIKEIVGVDVRLFAPPSGALGETLFDAAKSLDQKIIMWSRDTIDWRDKDENLVLKRATSDIQNGEFILLHPTEHTLKALPKILNNLHQKGFSVKPVSCCLNPTEV